MKPWLRLFTLLLVSHALAGCLGDDSPSSSSSSPGHETDGGPPADLGPDEPDAGALPPPLTGVRLNELSCRDGDWIELVNVSDGAVGLAGCLLTDALGDPGHLYRFPDGTELAAGAFLVVQRSGEGPGAGLPFGMRCGEETVHLLAPDGTELDSVDVGDPRSGLTWGRLPDGQGGWSATLPTPGAPNQPPALADVRLNEVQPRGDEWIELINLSATAADLEGWLLSETPEPDLQSYVIPAGAPVPPGGLLLIEQQTRRDDGFTFGLEAGEGSLWLLRPDGAVADQVDLPLLVPAASWGRLPDGEGAWSKTEPTPGEPNRAPEEPAATLYDPWRVPIIDLTLDEAARAALAVDPYTYVPGTFAFRASEAEPPGEPMAVGIRIKGRAGSFRPLDGKPALRIKLDFAIPEGRFMGLKTIMLNNLVQDASLLHEWLSYAILRKAGGQAPRVGYAWLRIDGEDYGLYADVEVYDGPWLDRHFLTTAHLYEGLYGQDLFVGHVLEFEMDSGDEGDRADLRALAMLAEQPPPAGFYQATLDPELVDWDQVLLQMAWEQWTGHWDGYAPTRNNYYFHFDDAGRLRLLPWGTDQTFGGALDFHHGQGLLLQHCLADPVCTRRYEEAIARVQAAVIALDAEPALRQLQEQLQPWVARDPRREYGADTVAWAVEATLDFLRWRQADVEALLDCLRGPDADPDGDGFRCQQDCGPDDPDVHPGAYDVCGDGIDQDCNGRPDDGLDCSDCSELRRGGRRYLVCYNGRTWDEARRHCQEQGADLVVIDAAGEHAWLFAAAMRIQPQDYWLGLNDRESEGSFVWVDGSTPGYVNWAPGEPNDAGGNEDCAHLWVDGSWNDLHCDFLMGMLCEEACEPGDGDGDGFDRCGADCDDGDPLAYPGAVEICGDGVDQDCSGVADDPEGGCP